MLTYPPDDPKLKAQQPTPALNGFAIPLFVCLLAFIKLVQQLIGSFPPNDWRF
jgi:hypothetical protein